MNMTEDNPLSNTSPLTALAPIVGRWRSSGTVLDELGNIESEILGTDTYRLLPDGHWIAHDVDVTIGDQRTVAHELIGGEHPDGGWAMYAFDRSAQPGVMRLTMPEPELLLLQGADIRSWFRFRAGSGHMTTQWERVTDGEWAPWMTMRFDRVD